MQPNGPHKCASICFFTKIKEFYAWHRPRRYKLINTPQAQHSNRFFAYSPRPTTTNWVAFEKLLSKSIKKNPWPQPHADLNVKMLVSLCIKKKNFLPLLFWFSSISNKSIAEWKLWRERRVLRAVTLKSRSTKQFMYCDDGFGNIHVDDGVRNDEWKIITSTHHFWMWVCVCECVDCYDWHFPFNFNFQPNTNTNALINNTPLIQWDAFPTTMFRCRCVFISISLNNNLRTSLQAVFDTHTHTFTSHRHEQRSHSMHKVMSLIR